MAEKPPGKGVHAQENYVFYALTMHSTGQISSCSYS